MGGYEIMEKIMRNKSECSHAFIDNFTSVDSLLYPENSLLLCDWLNYCSLSHSHSPYALPFLDLAMPLASASWQSVPPVPWFWTWPCDWLWPTQRWWIGKLCQKGLEMFLCIQTRGSTLLNTITMRQAWDTWRKSGAWSQPLAKPSLGHFHPDNVQKHHWLWHSSHPTDIWEVSAQVLRVLWLVSPFLQYHHQLPWEIPTYTVSR